MPTNLRNELKEFERELARVVAKFMRLYDRVEKEARPETRAEDPVPLPLRGAQPPRQLPGYQ